MTAIVIALIALVVICLGGWCLCEQRLNWVRAERDVLRQMVKKAPDVEDVMIAMAINEAIGNRPWRESP